MYNNTTRDGLDIRTPDAESRKSNLISGQLPDSFLAENPTEYPVFDIRDPVVESTDCYTCWWCGRIVDAGVVADRTVPDS